jgi:hypothetical protein
MITWLIQPAKVLIVKTKLGTLSTPRSSSQTPDFGSLPASLPNLVELSAVAISSNRRRLRQLRNHDKICGGIATTIRICIEHTAIHQALYAQSRGPVRKNLRHYPCATARRAACPDHTTMTSSPLRGTIILEFIG